jgi:predicted dehydrogenase
MEAYGTEGTLIAASDQMVEMIDPMLLGAKSGDDRLQSLSPPESLRWVPPEVPEGVAVNMGQMFRRFAQVIREGGEAPPDFQEAARLHHTLDAVERASDTAGYVRV